MKKLLLFDGNAILHRAFHALPPLTTKKGEPINAVYGMMSMTVKLLHEFKPQYLAYAFDTKEKTFRNELSPEYQSQRPEVDSTLISQFAKARDVLQAFRIPFYEKAGYEADDVIGTICKKLKGEEVEIVVVTGDRDLLQLVDNNVQLFMPSGGLGNGKMYGREETKEKMGVYPEFIVEYKSLVGDPSDNYRGVPGVGPKTAIKLIDEYKSLEHIFENLPKLPKSLIEKFEKGHNSAVLSKKLATIELDVPLPEFDLQTCAKWQLDSVEGISLFEEYGFNTLTKRVKEAAKAFVSDKQLPLL